MTPERWRRVQEVFAAATERAPDSRAAFLEESCRDDPELRAEVESLLSSLGAASSFLESPAMAAPPVFSPTPSPRDGSPSLSKGTHLGPYEVLSPLGSGGMGEVYRAQDPRLGREVAIKVLPAELSLDASRVRRFEKEARAASALNHPNIVTVYDVGASDGHSYIAMERVDGQTLRELLEGGALAIKRLLPIAAQVADGLARAHEAGIVHRDLKPENVMVTKEGLVKILDFGLAKLASPGSESGGSDLPAATGTTPGVILGTVGYMSPEQASGAALDLRSDQFSFGSILYEMTTGSHAFQGKTPIDTLGAILNDEPLPIAEVNPRVPTALRWIVERCLAKDPRQRYSSTDDLARDLAKLRDHLAEATSGVAPGSASRRRRVAPVIAVGAAALALAAAGLLLRRTSAQSHPIRFIVPPPPDTSIGGGLHSFAFSPDGSQLAFRANPTRSDPTRIWLRPLSDSQARMIPGTENVDSLFWAPDGRSIGYFASGKLWRVDVAGGAPIAICDVKPSPYYVGSWGTDGEILFNRFPGDAIYRVSTSDGKPEAIVKPDSARGEMTVTWPWFLPDGKSFLYLSQDAKGGSLMLCSLGGPSRRVMPLLSRVEYIEPGYLVFVREGALVAQRFDLRQGTLSGEPSLIADAVRYIQEHGFGAFATSLNGAIASATLPSLRWRMAWFDRTGRVVDRLEALAPLGLAYDTDDVAIDPAGRRVLFDRTQPKTRIHHLWILDLETKTEVRVTSDATDERSARWLPDGKSIVYTAAAGGMVQLRRRDLTTGRVEPLLPYGRDEQAGAVVPGGTQLMYATVTDEGNAETRFLDLSGDRKSVALPQATAFNEAALYSPDGRLILLASDASGRDEIYVAPSASPTERVPVSSGGALHGVAVWSRDGSEVFYVSRERQLMAVPIRETPSLTVEKPAALFTIREDAAWAGFDVSPDGKRFLAVYSEGVQSPIPLDVVLNWTAGAVTRGGAAP